MPGGRLSEADREQIARGLAQGLGYAEIARRLDRPTSTISREVARNGGAHAYRAQSAHSATGQRARRTPGPPLGEQPGHDAVDRLTERFATAFIAMGIAPMAAKVLSCLITTEAGSLTAADLVMRLRVSPASVSKAVRFLESVELLRRRRDPDARDGRGGRERYLVDNEVWLRSVVVSVRSNAILAEVAQQGAELFGADSPTGMRLEDMSLFFTYANRDAIAAAEHWWHEIAARRTANTTSELAEQIKDTTGWFRSR